MASKAMLELVVDLEDKATSKLGGITSGLGKLGLAGLGISTITGAVGGLVDTFGDLASAASAEKLGMDRLILTANNAGLTYAGLNDELNNSIAIGEAKAFADDQVRDSLGLLVSKLGNVEDATKMQAIAMDLARAKNIDLAAATKLVMAPASKLSAGLAKLGILTDKNSTSQEQLEVAMKATAGAADLYAESSEGAGVRAAAAIDNAKEDIGAALLPLQQEIMGGFAEFLSSDAFQGAITTTAEVLGTVLGGAVTLVKGAFEVLQPIISTAAGIFTAFFSNVQSGSGTMQPVIDILTNLGKLLGETIGTAITNLQAIWLDVWPQIQAAVLPVLEAVFGELSRFWTEIEPKLAEVWAQIQSVIETVMPIVQNVIGAGLKFISDLWGNVWPGIQQVLSGVWNVIKGVVQVAWGVVSGIISAGLSLLSGDWEGAWEAIQQAAATVWEGIQNIVSGAFDIIVGLFNVILGELKTLWNAAWGLIGDKVTEIWESITGEIDKQINAAKTTIDAVTLLIKNAWDSFWGDVGKKVTEIWNSITGEIDKQINSAKTTISAVTGLIKSAWDSFWGNLWNKVSSTWDSISSGIGTKLGEIKTLIEGVPANLQAAVLGIGSSIVGGIVQGLKDAWGTIEQTIHDLAANLPQPIKDALGIKSPSKEMADEVGSPIAAGILVGMQQGWADVLSGAKELVLELQELFYKYVRDDEQEYSLAWHWKTAFQFMFGFINETWGPMIKELIKGNFTTIAEIIGSSTQGFASGYIAQWVAMADATVAQVARINGAVGSLPGGGGGYVPPAGGGGGGASGGAGAGSGGGNGGPGAVGAMSVGGAQGFTFTGPIYFNGVLQTGLTVSTNGGKASMRKRGMVPLRGAG